MLKLRILSIIIHSRRLKHFLHLKFILQLLISGVYQNMPSIFPLPIISDISYIQHNLYFLYIMCKVVQKRNIEPIFEIVSGQVT